MRCKKSFIIGTVLVALTACGLESQLERDAKKRAASLMNDPASTVFENITIYSEKNIVCGELNSKNALGAYAGLQAFVFKDGSVVLERDRTFNEADRSCSLAGEESRNRLSNMTTRLTRHVDDVIGELERSKP